MDPLDELVAGVRSIGDPTSRALAAHRLLPRLSAAVADVAFLRREALRELHDSGFSHAELGKLLGVHRNRAAHLVAD